MQIFEIVWEVAFLVRMSAIAAIRASDDFAYADSVHPSPRSQRPRRLRRRLGRDIDPERIILMGGSAGAGTSLWIGFNDDMADPDSDDPVLRQSTRVSAIVAIATQATYDIGKWSSVVFAEYNLDLLELANALGLAQALLDFYGISDVADFDSPAILDYRARVDMLDLMDAKDPPFYVQNDLEPAAAPLTVNLAFHHANHALVLAEEADAIGLENVAYMKALMIEDPSGED